jgi:hypothetical protein
VSELACRTMTDVTVAMKLYVVSGGEYPVCEIGVCEHSLADHEERRGCGAGLELLKDPRRPSWVGAVVEGEAERAGHVAGMPERETGGGRAGHGWSWYSRRNPSNRRRWPSSSWRIAITMSFVTGSNSSVASMIWL